MIFAIVATETKELPENTNKAFSSALQSEFCGLFYV